jgi:CheY-like chemotaxis protein
VLIVDDNAANLDVAKSLMRPYGMQIDCVTGGQQAIDAMRGEKVKYNAIFMDHMMPGMDGIEAAQRIRKINTDYARRIPIIALTANALAGSEEMFLGKGFQAFLSKPIDIPRLDEVIRRWVRDREQEKLYADGHILIAQGGRDRRAIVSRRSGLDRRKVNMKFVGLDIDKGVERFGGNRATYYEVLRSYIANTRPLLDAMEQVGEDALHAYAITVHGIKGSSRGIFANMIGDSAELLERAAKIGDFAYVSAHTPTFVHATRKLIDDLDVLLSDADAGNPKPAKDKPDGAVLAKLCSACETYDMDGVDAAMDELGKYQYQSDDGLVAWLVENIRLMNFSQITEKLSSLVA